MNGTKLQEFIAERKIVLPLYFLRMYQELNVNMDEMVLLIYLYNQDKTTYNPELISQDLCMDMYFVIENISNLTDKGLIKVNSIKNEHGVMEEVLDISPLYNKISLKIMKLLNQKEVEELNIHDLIETEFNRRLSPLEHDVIDEWEKNNYSKELVKEAVKEASLNGVNNLRYIDKILIDWAKKGYKSKEDIKKNIDIINEQKKEEEVFKYDWLNEDEEI